MLGPRASEPALGDFQLAVVEEGVAEVAEPGLVQAWRTAEQARVLLDRVQHVPALRQRPR